MSDYGPNTSHGYTTPGTTYVGDVPQPFFRDDMDASRSMWRRTPDAEYPSGYLGTIQSRREDRLLDAVKNRVNKKSYDRGVHVGERVDRSEYFWPKGYEFESGLVRQATTGLRQAPKGIEAPAVLVNDGKSARPGQSSYAVVNPYRQEQLRRLGPTWR
jgi:hypothetical protein